MGIVRLSLVVLALTGSPATPAAGSPEQGRNTIEFEDQQRVFHLHLPPTYDGQTDLPLVIVLHGGGGNGPRIAKQTDFEAKADAEGFVAVFPTGQDAGNGRHYWNTEMETADHPVRNTVTGDDMGFIATLIDHLTDELAIDEQRIYVTGFSNGAGLTHRLACELSDRIAAAAAVASALSAECDPVSPVAVMQMNGADDPHFQEDLTIEVDGQQIDWWYAIEFWSDYNGCPAEPTVTVVDRVTTETHGPCAAGTEVVRIELDGVGHKWPGGPNDPVAGTDVVWDFFARHTATAEATPVAAA